MAEVKKVTIHLRSVGEAPKLEKPRVQIDGSKPIIKVENYLRNTLKLKPTDSLYFFCGSGFSPTPDQTLSDLFECFQVSNELVVQYAFQEAWG